MLNSLTLDLEQKSEMNELTITAAATTLSNNSNNNDANRDGEANSLPMMTAVLTYHAQERAQERQFKPAEIGYVLQYGQKIYRTGICFCFLGERNIPLADRSSAWAQHLIGTTVLLNVKDRVIITVYRNKSQKALREIKRKTKFRR